MHVTAGLHQLIVPIGFAKTAEDVLMDKKFDSNKFWLKLMKFGRLTKCHQIPERSFFINGYQFPVCARCTGFYIMFLIYFIYTYFFYVNYNHFLILFSILLLIPAVVDGTSQLKGLRESNNYLRFFTGLIGGLGLGIIIKAIKYYILILL